MLAVLGSDVAHAASKLSRFEESQPHMGTVARIVIYAASSEAAATATRSAFERIRELDNVMSDYKAESELTRLSHQSGGPPVHIGSDLFRVLAAAQNLAVRSDGAFDVTAGPVIRLWRRARRQRALPERDRLTAALELTGFRRLTLDSKQKTAWLTKPGMLLDVGGVAKGYAADEALEMLKRAGIERALVALGGDIAVSNPPPGKKGWSIEIASLNLATPQAPSCSSTTPLCQRLEMPNNLSRLAEFAIPTSSIQERVKRSQDGAASLWWRLTGSTLMPWRPP